jgi:hypothetical protein
MAKEFPKTGDEYGIYERSIKAANRKTLWTKKMCIRACNLCTGLYWAIKLFKDCLALGRIGSHSLENHFGTTRSVLRGDQLRAQCESSNETLASRITNVERKMSETLSPIIGRLSVCGQRVEHVKAASENERDAVRRNIAIVEQIISLLRPEFERKISDSLSTVSGRLSICETALERLK